MLCDSMGAMAAVSLAVSFGGVQANLWPALVLQTLCLFDGRRGWRKFRRFSREKYSKSYGRLVFYKSLCYAMLAQWAQGLA